MTMFAATYYILPHIAGVGAVSASRVRLQFWLSMIGTVLFAFPLVIGGVIQGFKLVNPQIAFLDALKSSLMPFRVSTLGETLLIIGNLLFLFNVGYAIVCYYRSVCKIAWAEATTPLEPAGVKA